MKKFYTSARKNGMVRFAPMFVLALAGAAVCFAPKASQAHKGAGVDLAKMAVAAPVAKAPAKNPEMFFPRPNEELPATAQGAFLAFGVAGPNFASVEGSITDGKKTLEGKATLKGDHWALEFKRHDFKNFTLTVKMHVRKGETITRVIPLQMQAEEEFLSAGVTINGYSTCSNEFWCFGTYGDQSAPTLASALTISGTANIVSIADQGLVADNTFVFIFPPVPAGVYDLYVVKLMQGAWIVQTGAHGLSLSHCE